MMEPTTLRRIGLALFAALLLVCAGTAGAVAQDRSEAEPVRIGAQHLVVSDATLTIGDVQVRGDGVEQERVENRSYYVDHAELTLEGLNLRWDGTTYNVCRVEVVLDDVGIVIEDATTGGS